jgi:serine/threonine-protein kinase
MLKKNPALWLALLLSVIFLVLALLQVGFLESLELSTYDLRMKLRANGPETPTDIALVDIDDDSITKLGRWPWPRAMVARMVDKLKAQGATIIGLNVIFSEPEVGEGLKLVEELRNDFTSRFAVQGDPAATGFLDKLTEAQNRLDNDKRLAEAMAGAGNVVLPVFFQIGEFPQPEPDQPDFIKNNGLLQVQGPVLDYMFPAKKITAPIPEFSAKSAGLGHINYFQDRDGAIRRENLLINYRGLAFPSYTLKLALLAQGLGPDQVSASSGQEGRDGLKIGKQFVPTNPNLDYYITFTDSRAFPRYSFFDVLNDKVEASALKGKIVLIGVSATGVDIPQVTPLDTKMSTATLAANALHNILNGGFITRSGLMSLVELVILVLIGVFLSLFLPRLKARSGALASVILLVVIIGAGVYLFVGPGLWLKITYPVLLTVLGYAAVTTTRYFVTEVIKDKAQGESAEVNRMLGLSFQNQGQLDLAFDKFRRVPMDDGMKDIVYNLALDYERKRMFNKAVSVYEYIKEYDENFRDIKAKIKKLNVASDTLIFGLGTGGQHGADGSLVIDGDTRPTLGRYEIIKELGKGAMGIVYLGRDPQIGREMAIKTIRFTDEYEDDEAERIKDQFFAEAKTAGLLSHPNIVTIFDAGTDHDLSYIAMEYLEGYDLKEHASPNNLLPIREVIRHVADVAEGLGYAHGKGVVHRDIKPANIMLLKSGVAKVTDFGIARAMASSKTKTGVVKGTPFYMSPEQITGKKVDGRTDIFSLGVVLYELLSGTQPFRADDLTGLIYKITSDDPDPIHDHNPKIPKALVQIIEKALTKDRDRRYQKAEQMAEHLRMVGRKMDELAARKQTN